MAKNDRDAHDFYDSPNSKRTSRVYQACWHTFLCIYLKYLRTVEVLKEQNSLILNTSKPILHLNATGSIIRKPFKESNGYYAGVIQVLATNRVYPVLEMVSSAHDAGSILSWSFNLNFF